LSILSNTLDLRIVDIRDFNTRQSACGMLKLIPQIAIKEQSNNRQSIVKQVIKDIEVEEPKHIHLVCLLCFLSLAW
jgi:hypothetical protein